ncbi:MAG: hypothetical protein ACYSTZ_05695 [Planctomycetota bacterium]|jgi:hypothetical protein
MADNFLEPEDDQTIPLVEPTERMPGLAGYIRAKFEDAENGRYVYEQRWLQAYKNFRGIYDSTTQYRDSERSKVFIKITKTKVLAAYGQIVDILFANKKFPLVVESTPMPEGIAEFAHMRTPADEIQQSDPYGFPGDGRELMPGAMSASEPHVLGSYGKEFGDMLVPGKAKVGEPQFEPAKEQARRMEKCIHDQLLDTNAVNVFRKAIFESALLGTGIVKGPFNFHKRIHQWKRGDDGEREYEPYEKTVPRIEPVSVWDFHPDPSATTIEDCEYVIERHRMNRQQLRSLIMRPHFDAEAIRECLAKGPNYEDKYYEDTIREDETEPYVAENRYEVLEYWGVLDAQFADAVGMEEAKNMSEFDQIQVNVWVCGNMVLRCVVNPWHVFRIKRFRSKSTRTKFGVSVLPRTWKTHRC